MNKKLHYIFVIFTLLSCKKTVEPGILEIRLFEVAGIEKDSIWFDTVFVSPSKRSDLSNLIYKVDSILTKNSDEINSEGFSLVISGFDTLNGYTLTWYFVEYPNEIGHLSFFGVNVESIGTIYWRWLDGHQYLRLAGKHCNGERFTYDSLLTHLDTTILAIPPVPKEFNIEIEHEIAMLS
jgi:hypothetical protein